MMTLVALSALIGCAANPRTAEQPVGQIPELSGSAEDAAAAAEIQQALERAISDPAAREAVELIVECQGDAGMRAVHIFGTGVGIWENRRQFVVASEELSSLLMILRDAGFSAMKKVYGGRPATDPRRPDPPEALNAIMVMCAVRFSAEGATKETVQLAKGEKSPELRQLAEDVIAACAPLAKGGVEATGLRDGLEKISRGELAAEALTLMLHRKPGPRDAEGPGLLMRISGGRVTTSSYAAASGYGETVALRPATDEYRDLGRTLAELDLEDLPINLYSPAYTDLSIQVLNHKRSIQARQFAGMTAETHGEHQRDFDLLFERLYDLHLHVLATGTPEPSPTQKQ
jgi:hypothetical protein